MSRLMWRRVDREPWSGERGDVGGGDQATKSYSVRFRPVEEPDDGLFAMVTAYHYGAHHPEAPANGFWVVQQAEFLVCTDPDDPGGTEVGSFEQYDEGDTFYATAKAAEQAARALAVLADANDVNWDGRTMR